MKKTVKKISLILIILSVAGFSCSDKSNITIEGEFRNGEKKMIYLERFNINKTIPLDSQKISKNTSFRFRIYNDHPELYVLRNEEGKIINVLSLPGETVNIQGDYSDFETKYSVSGSKESEYVRQLVEKLYDTRNRLNKLDTEFNQNKDLATEQSNLYFGRQSEIVKDQRDFSVQFIVGHLNSLASIYALYQKLGPDQLVLGDNKDIQYMKIVADTLSVKYPEVPLVKVFVDDARSAERRYYTMLGLQKKMGEVKTSLPDIALPDINGKEQNLSSLKGKTVLLYFWSPLSEDCLKQNRDLLQTYLSYKKKGFEIFAVAITDDLTAWNNTIVLDELSWKNVIERDPASQTLWSYNLTDIPTSFLLNNEGEVIARNLFGNDLKIWLDNVIK